MAEVISSFSEEVLRDAAKQAHLRYVSDAMPGITRKRAGRGFVYHGPDKSRITEAEVLERIAKLAIPPAYRSVWICPVENGHLQATGRDDRHRKQYRYHTKWAELRSLNKFEQMAEFAEALPKIRSKVSRDMSLPELPKQRVVASIVALMDRTAMRIGNEQYANENKTYGLTTLRKSHVEVTGNKIHFSFIGKSGKEWQRDINAPRIAKIISQCEELPGQELFKYVSDDGTRHPIHSDDVNAYLQEITGKPFTAKDFRTWSATYNAIVMIAGLEPATTQRQAKQQLNAAIKQVAEILGHTPTICRQSYIHPKVLSYYEAGTLRDWFDKQQKRDDYSLVGALLAL